MDLLAIFISIGALLFSIYTYSRHDKKLKEQSAKLNKYHLDKFDKQIIEEKKAIIEANVVPARNNSKIIKVYNKGKSIARNVFVKVPESNEYYVFINPSPIDIRPQQGIDIRLGAFTEGHIDKIEIKFEWEDDFKESNKDSQIIQI